MPNVSSGKAEELAPANANGDKRNCASLSVPGAEEGEFCALPVTAVTCDAGAAVSENTSSDSSAVEQATASIASRLCNSVLCLLRARLLNEQKVRLQSDTGRLTTCV